MKDEYLILTRHSGAVEFIKRNLPEFKDASVKDFAEPNEIKGKIVAGVIPLVLIPLCKKAYAIVFPKCNAPRGYDITYEQMIEAGAEIWEVALFYKKIQCTNS